MLIGHSVPSLIKHCCQDTLTAHWTRRLPLLQQRAPAELAAAVIAKALDDIDIDGRDGSSEWTVIDFCSGAGGPVPTIERRVNSLRMAKGLRPIPFRLSDLHPNLDAWMEHASRSDHLSFIPQPVDATNPPFSAISATTPGDQQAALKAGLRSDGHKVFRLYCLSFHHFGDEAALRVMESTLETSDAFAIVELQDRQIGSLLLLMLEFWLLLLVTVFWFPDDAAHLLLTYAVPVLPLVQCFDGLVSCLRTRTPAEIAELVHSVKHSKHLVGSDVVRHAQGWQLGTVKLLHTWPVGYMTASIGIRRTTDVVTSDG